MAELSFTVQIQEVGNVEEQLFGSKVAPRSALRLPYFSQILCPDGAG